MRSRRRIEAFYPFSLFGSLLGLFALALLGQAIVARDRYGQLLAWSAVALLAVLAVVGRLLAVRFNSAAPSVAAAASLFADRPSGLLAVDTGVKLPVFFRAHVVLCGALAVDERELFAFNREYRLKRSGATVLELAPPLCGQLSYEARYLIKDILGLSSWLLGAAGSGSVPVRPSYLDLPPAALRSAADSRDAKPPLKKTDDEKIFVREYQSGDLSRDINWKASGRIRKLLTRIPPTARQESQRLELRIRTAMPSSASGFAAHCHLAALKTIVHQFLAQARRLQPGCAFKIMLNAAEYLVNGDSDLDEFVADFCACGPFSAGEPPAAVDPAASTIFLFTTCLDKGLSDELAALGDRAVHLFLTQPAEKARRAGTAAASDMTAEDETAADFTARLWSGDRIFRPRAILLGGAAPARLSVATAIAGRHQFGVKAALI